MAYFFILFNRTSLKKSLLISPEQPIPDRGIKPKIFSFLQMMLVMKSGCSYKEFIKTGREKLPIQMSYGSPNEINQQVNGN